MIAKHIFKALFPGLYLVKYKRFAETKLRHLNELKLLSLEERITLLKTVFLNKVGYELNLDSPRTWCEKMQWLKLFDATLRKSQLTDKLMAKELVGNMIGKRHIIPVLAEGYSFDDLDFCKMPNQFVIKTNHGSGTNFFVTNKWFFLHSGLKEVARTYFSYWLQMDYGYDDSFELHYSAIEPRVFVEPYVPSLFEDLNEFRFMCFEGIPRYVEVKTGKDGEFRNIYDTDWNAVDACWGHERNFEVEKPVAFDEMKKIAKILCEGFHFVRIDMNLVGDEIYFGEMTFTSYSGFVRIEPKEFDYILGDLIRL